MLSKGSVAVLPVLLLLIVWWQRRRIDIWDLVRTAPFFVVAIVLTGVNVWFQKHGLDVMIRNVNFSQRLAGAGAVVWFYLAKALAPIHLVFVYPNWQIKASTPLWWLPLAAVLIVTILLARSILSQRATWRHALLFAWLFFCVALVPVLGFTDVGFMQYALVADHYQHIAIIAVVALAAAGFSAWHKRMQGAAIVTAVALVGMLAFLTWQQNKMYSTPLALYQATLDQNPDSWPIHNDAGAALRKIGRIQEAIDHYKHALRLNPNYSDAHYNYGNVLMQLGQTTSAIDEYERSLRLQPKRAAAHDNLGSALAQVGRSTEAIDHFEQSLRINPNSPIAHNNLGNVLGALGHSQDALAQYQEALRLKPDYAEAHNNLGFELLETDLPEAIKQFRLALQLNPSYADAHNNLAGALANSGQTPEAIEHYREALRLKSGYTETYLNLAKTYAQVDRRAEAIETAEKGLDLARSQGKAQQAKEIEDWLTEYRSQADRSQQPAQQDKVHSSP